MVQSSGSGWWVDVLWVLAFGVASSVWCLTAAAQFGATFDEPFYLDAGLTSWRTGSNKPLMSKGTMSLPIDVQTLPVYLWERHRGEPFHAYKDISTILPVARAANLAFWWLLLVYALLLGRTFGGPWAGRFAVGLIAADPNFLGHAALATTDIAVVACLLALVYHFHHGQGCSFRRRVLIPGIWYGLAVLAKGSGMVFGVQIVLVLGIWHLYHTGALLPAGVSTYRQTLVHVWHAGYPLRKDLCWIMLIGFVVAFAYTGSDWTTEHTFVEWADSLPDGTTKSVLLPVSQHLRIFPNAGEALMQQVKHNLRGHGTYLLGEWYDRATWKYFPVALSIKTPIPALGLLLVVMLVRPRGLNTPLGWVALVLFLFSLNCRVQIGIRFMFTLTAVAYAALAVAVTRSWRGENRLAIPGWFVGGLIATTAVISVWIWPHGLSYANQLWGGTETAYRHLSDSNYDWGHGLPELKAWHHDHGGTKPLAVWYYGTDPAILYEPFRPVLLHMLPSGSEAEIRRAIREKGGGRYIAVSMSLLYGIGGLNDAHTAVLRWFRAQTPITRTTHFFIFDLGE